MPPTSHARTSERVRAVEGLLDARQLLLAVAGNIEGGSPLIAWARELADLHSTLITASASPARRPADFDDTTLRGRIGDIVVLVDEWSVFHLPRPTTARRHTHSLGEVISHLANTYAHMQWTLRHNDSAHHQHHATLRFAQVQQGYADLIDDIRTLRVELPLGLPGHIATHIRAE
ncbi:hypothetical protein HLB23_15545 [Nocardia uniformis]|uniref:Uncharacterized protein n=1 Tax=Nocardia uniformis TaxID=53432 RepID=A0A849C0U5_9NOCA|nr:hypothetical protein [Nocardia uniformis]NNH71258.1 hypothetical protein [Nocardia uniformis]